MPHTPASSESDPSPASTVAEPRLRIQGKLFRLGHQPFFVKGVTYGTFAPGADGSQFPSSERVDGDFALMAARGFNAVRVYTPPRPEMLDQAQRWGLRLMVGLPWTQHVAFLDDARLCRRIRAEVRRQVRALRDHPAVMLFALGNEIPPAVVRWHGARRVEAFLRELLEQARQAAPDGAFTYVNYPPTEFLDQSAFDVCAFNVYLHDPEKLRAYLARLQHIAGHKPLLLAEAGADSIREGEPGQAELTAMHVRAAFGEGLCGAFAYAWTDEWWRGGQAVEDWAFGLVDRHRRPKRALAAVARAFEDAPFPEQQRRSWPRVSVVVCAYNAADTLEDCLASLERLDYPDYEVIVVNDGSRDATPAIARRHLRFRTVDVHPNGGLSAARNVGLAQATGEIVAYTDADVRVDPEWLTYLVQPFLHSDVVGSGGPNVVPPDDPWIAQCVARAPGGPTHVLLDDRVAEHVPGCNMAFRREALLAIGGFNPVFLRAGDDVDVCWRLQARGHRIGFAPAALVWHHHRATVKAYWRQQVGYGEGELWLAPHHPDKFAGRHVLWRGRIYSPLPFVRALSRRRVNAGPWGQAAFPSVYYTGAPAHAYLPHSVQWLAAALGLLAVGLAGLASPWAAAALLAAAAGAGLLGATALRCVLHALRTDVHGLAPLPGRTPRQSRRRYRGMIAWLHFLQPLARLRGLVRGLLNPPAEVPLEPAAGPPARRGWPSRLGECAAVLRLLGGGTLAVRYWGEAWTGIETVLGGIVRELRAARGVRAIAVDDGWQHDRDVSVAVGPWARLELRALVEEHARGRVLLRVSTRLRPTGVGIAAMSGGAIVLAGALTGIALRWPAGSLAAVALLGAIAARLLVGLPLAAAALARAVDRTAAVAGMSPLARPAGARRGWRRNLEWAARGAAAVLVGGLLSASAAAIVQGALPAIWRAEPAGAPAPPGAAAAAAQAIAIAIPAAQTSRGAASAGRGTEAEEAEERDRRGAPARGRGARRASRPLLIAAPPGR